MPTSQGSVTLIGSGALIASGRQVRVYSLTFTSGASVGAIQLYNGTAASGTPVWSQEGTASRSFTQNFEGGLLFPAGCYVSFDGASAAILACAAEP
jgi:hypothetical protein